MSEQLLWTLPFALQGLAMGVDELGFHRRRPVSRWEWRGHMLDTAVFLACLACPALLAPTPAHLGLYGTLAVASCLLITKDEFVQHVPCTGGEHWIHAVLFLLHPVVLMASGFLWVQGAAGFLALQAALVGGFLLFQAVLGAGRGLKAINNGIYEELGERWYDAQDDPVALLRSESKLLNAWVAEELRAPFGSRPLRILDVGCGAGFLANPLARDGHVVTGIDLSGESLRVAQRHDSTRSVEYLPMDARTLAFPDATFDVVCMMDFLEHLEERDAAIGEASRVLKPGGRLFFHTFNRTPLSWLIAIKGVEWSVMNTPKNMHVYSLFLKPSELRDICGRHRLRVEEVRGVNARVFTWAFLRLLVTARVSDGFRFGFTRYQGIGYCGHARKGQEAENT